MSLFRKAESKKRLIRKGYVSSIVGDKGSDPATRTSLLAAKTQLLSC